MSPSSNDGLVQQQKDFKKVSVGILQFDAEGERIDEFASLNRFLFYKSVVILFGDYFEKEIYLGYREGIAFMILCYYSTKYF